MDNATNCDDLYKRYHKKVLKYLNGMVGAADAEDLTQEVFIRAGSKLGSLKDHSKLSPWIFKIALNAALDRLRKPDVRNAAGGRVCSLSDGENAEDALERLADVRGPTPEECLMRTEMVQCFVEFVRKLPKTYYEVYALNEFEELPDKAISKRLALPLETVKMRLHRARTRLYQELRLHCRCYYNERGELMGDRKQKSTAKTNR